METKKLIKAIDSLCRLANIDTYSSQKRALSEIANMIVNNKPQPAIKKRAASALELTRMTTDKQFEFLKKPLP